MRYLMAFLLLTLSSVSLSAQSVRPRDQKQLPPPTATPGDPPPVPLDARPGKRVPPVERDTLPPPRPLAPPPIEREMPPVVTSPKGTVQAMTLGEFAKHFQPERGRASYEVVLIHPCTGKPVLVCFDLPGCPRRMLVGKTELVFRFGLCKKATVVTFCRDGSVRVG